MDNLGRDKTNTSEPPVTNEHPQTITCSDRECGKTETLEVN